MTQVVRRQPFISKAIKMRKPAASRKSKFVEKALILLACANLFVASSALCFYWLANRH
jgi:hypothetical protein